MELVLESGVRIALQGKRTEREGGGKLEEVPLDHLRALPPLDVDIQFQLPWAEICLSHHQQYRPSFFPTT